MKHLTRIGRRHRLAVVGVAIVALGLLGAAVDVALLPRTPDARAERAVAASRPAVIREKSKPAVTKAKTKPAVTQAKSKPAVANASKHVSVPSAPSTIARQMPNPVRISIPAIGVDARVIPLGLNPDRTLEVPKNLADTGWFALGPEPGEQGAAVVAGHLESLTGPGVFYRLRQLRVGQVITIRLQDGSAVRYVADSMIRVSKGRFPTNRVYAQTKQPTLRLITCVGKMNPSTGYHPDNFIVFASLVR